MTKTFTVPARERFLALLVEDFRVETAAAEAERVCDLWEGSGENRKGVH